MPARFNFGKPLLIKFLAVLGAEDSMVYGQLNSYVDDCSLCLQNYLLMNMPEKPLGIIFHRKSILNSTNGLGDL